MAVELDTCTSLCNRTTYFYNCSLRKCIIPVISCLINFNWGRQETCEGTNLAGDRPNKTGLQIGLQIQFFCECRSTYLKVCGEISGFRIGVPISVCKESSN
jgi:hypothetical protein